MSWVHMKFAIAARGPCNIILRLPFHLTTAQASVNKSLSYQIGVSENRGVPDFGVLRIRTLLFRVLY